MPGTNPAFFNYWKSLLNLLRGKMRYSFGYTNFVNIYWLTAFVNHA